MHRHPIAAFVMIALTHMATAEVYDVRYGTFEAPAGFHFEHTGTLDSFRGSLTREADGFTISFDIGSMAGTHMGESRQRDCTFYRSHRVSGIPAFTGIQRASAGMKITTSIYDPAHPGTPAPANFWADIKSESDIADFLLIVSTYMPKNKEHP